MKKWIITAAIVLSSVSVANAERLTCEIVQVLPGFFLPQCTTYDRYEYRGHYRDNSDSWEHHRGGRHDRYAWNNNRHDRRYYNRDRTPHLDRDVYERPYRRDHQRW